MWTHVGSNTEFNKNFWFLVRDSEEKRCRPCLWELTSCKVGFAAKAEKSCWFSTNLSQRRITSATVEDSFNLQMRILEDPFGRCFLENMLFSSLFIMGVASFFGTYCSSILGWKGHAYFLLTILASGIWETHHFGKVNYAVQFDVVFLNSVLWMANGLWKFLSFLFSWRNCASWVENIMYKS